MKNQNNDKSEVFQHRPLDTMLRTKGVKNFLRKKPAARAAREGKQLSNLFRAECSRYVETVQRCVWLLTGFLQDIRNLVQLKMTMLGGGGSSSGPTKQQCIPAGALGDPSLRNGVNVCPSS